MRYLGSKNKISKELAPIIQGYIKSNTVAYIEPFVGGANMIDKINHSNKIGYDIHLQLIELLKKTRDNLSDIPDYISFETYNNVKANKDKFPDWHVGLVGFCASFGGKYFNGYARDSKGDVSGKWSKGAIKNLKKQAPNLKNIQFYCSDFLNIDTTNWKNCVIYCDIPYKNTTKYLNKFPYENFYKWVKELSKNNTVLISEYWMPSEFECIWEKEVKVNFDSNRLNANNRVEKLFKIKE